MSDTTHAPSRKEKYESYLRARPGYRREYSTKEELLADTSKAKFSCLAATTDERNGRVTSLWSGTLPNGTELFIVSINRHPEEPRYDRGSINRDEALSFFSRFQKAATA